MLDFLFTIIGFIPAAFAVIWFCGSVMENDGTSNSNNENRYLVNTIGSFFLFIFGISIIGVLRSFVNDSVNLPIILICGGCLIVAIICLYIAKKRNY